MKLGILQYENGLSDCLVEFFATNQATLQRKTSFSHHLDCQIQVKEGMRKREIYIKPTKVVDIGELVHFPLSIKVTTLLPICIKVRRVARFIACDMIFGKIF